MRYLIISDLHSNREALEAVLKAARGLHDRIVCCGDLAGYGPDPNHVIDWARKNLDAVIRGNHDRACSGLESLEWFNPVAKMATEWTMANLSPENLAWLLALTPGPMAVDGFRLIHGSPLDEDEYVTSLTDARNVFSYLEGKVGFFGHTHLQGGFSWVNGLYSYAVQMDPFNCSRKAKTVFRLDPDGSYLINPGSVGQPRDGDPRAAWAIYDSDEKEVALHRTAYDWEKTCGKIQAAGLPDILGTRLGRGH